VNYRLGFLDLNWGKIFVVKIKLINVWYDWGRESMIIYPENVVVKVMCEGKGGDNSG
jgi:hypothetical protein